ncbi:MAG: hypothetical protein ABIK96_17455 [bacterium]
MARSFKGKRNARRRLDDLLDQVKGKVGDSRDHRRGERWGGYRTLDVRRDRELFDRLVQLDFDYLMQQHFTAGPRTLADLLPQSVLGRAQNGHGWFTDEWGVQLQFPDATFDRILTVLEGSDPNLKGHLVRKRRGDMLRRFCEWTLANLQAADQELVIDGHPVFGVDFLADARVDMRAFLTGLVLAGFMDDWSYRETSMMQYKRTFAGFPYHIGGGDILIVDREKFEMCGLGDTGATVFVDDQLRELRRVGVVMADRDKGYSYPDQDQVYFRRCAGDGISDDMAMLFIGAMYGYDAMLGAFVMDAIDSYDKYVVDLVWGGLDTHLARTIQKRFLDLEGAPLVDDRRILELIHFAAKRQEPFTTLSSSHRRFIQLENPANVPTLLNHWRFLQGQPVYDIKLGYSRIPARQFYATARQRFTAFGLDVKDPEFLKKPERAGDRSRETKHRR